MTRTNRALKDWLQGKTLSAQEQHVVDTLLRLFYENRRYVSGSRVSFAEFKERLRTSGDDVYVDSQYVLNISPRKCRESGEN